VPPIADWGVSFTTVSLDPSVYLFYLQSQLLKRQIKFKRFTVPHIQDAFKATTPAAELVVNATGILASRLGGVEDKTVVPIRGQLVIVENESHGVYLSSIFDKELDKSIGENMYIIDRPNGGGTAIGGSNYETWDSKPDMALAERMMQRAIQICPELVPDGAGTEALRVVRHQVGFRPFRKGGVRVEVDHGTTLGEVGKDKKIVHAYGLGSAGYQRSWGLAADVVNLVIEEMK
jgi:D-amino-acid oxidase